MIKVLCSSCDSILPAQVTVAPTPVTLADAYAPKLQIKLMQGDPVTCGRCGFVNKLYLGYYPGRLGEEATS